MIEIWKKQFKRQQFLLFHKEPTIFITSQWQTTNRPSLLYLIYRWAFALFFLTIWLLSIILNSEYDNPLKWMIYLTNWGLTICTAQALVVAIMLTIWFVEDMTKKGCFNCLNDFHCESVYIREFSAEENKKLIAPKPYRIYWAINNIATVLAFAITIVYWGVLYKPTSDGLDVINILSHAINSCLMFLDLWIVAHPIRLVHCYLTVLFGTIYLIFSIIYWAVGGTDREGYSYIYTILDWDKPGQTAAYCVGVLAFFLILHCFVFGIYHLRRCIFKKIVKKRSGDEHAMTEVYVNRAMINDIP